MGQRHVSRQVIIGAANPICTRPVAVGGEQTCRLIAGIGVTPGHSDCATEIDKAVQAQFAGAHLVADHSLLPDAHEYLQSLRNAVSVPLCTVPTYQTMARTVGVTDHDVLAERLLEDFEMSAKSGCDVLTVHASCDPSLLEHADATRRIIPTTSRGGGWMVAAMRNDPLRRNPARSIFEGLLDLAGRYGVTLSLGNTFRPGTTLDRWDDPLVLEEIARNAELARMAKERGVAALLEIGGHVALNEIGPYIRHAASVSDAPIRTLMTCADATAGQDHISGALAAAEASMAGAAVVMCVSRSEHLRLPHAADLTETIAATRTAVYAGDLARGRGRSTEMAMTEARKRCDWAAMQRATINPLQFIELAGEPPADDVGCSMCGSACPFQIAKESLSGGA